MRQGTRIYRGLEAGEKFASPILAQTGWVLGLCRQRVLRPEFLDRPAQMGDFIHDRIDTPLNLRLIAWNCGLQLHFQLPEALQSIHFRSE
jgi:hypothetical protein